MTDAADRVFRVRYHSLIGEGNPVWQDEHQFISAFNAIEERTIVSPFRCYTLYQMAKQCNGVDGSFAQVGVYRGGSAKLIASVKNPAKHFFIFDTFEGLPENDPRIDIYGKGKFGDTTLEEVVQFLDEVQNLHVHKGIFPDTAIHIPEDERFAFVYLDVDIYKSNMDSLRFFYPKMNPGGVIVIDDYGFENCPGIERSVRDFLNETGAGEIPIVVTKYQAMLIKL